jgi:acetyl-CoA carboxylase carboxyl transferase subunit alpha
MISQYGIYSVISPEGCASILFKSAARAQEAAEAMKVTAKDLYEHKLVDEIVPEPLGGAHRDVAGMMTAVKSRLIANLERLRRTPVQQLLSTRYERLMSFGAYETKH